MSSEEESASKKVNPGTENETTRFKVEGGTASKKANPDTEDETTRFEVEEESFDTEDEIMRFAVEEEPESKKVNPDTEDETTRLKVEEETASKKANPDTEDETTRFEVEEETMCLDIEDEIMRFAVEEEPESKKVNPDTEDETTRFEVEEETASKKANPDTEDETMRVEVEEKSARNDTEDETTRFEESARKKMKTAFTPKKDLITDAGVLTPDVVRVIIGKAFEGSGSIPRQMKRMVGIEVEKVDVEFLLRQTRMFDLVDEKDLKAVESFCKRFGKIRVPAYDLIKENKSETGQAMTLLPYDSFEKDSFEKDKLAPYDKRATDMIPYPANHHFTSRFANVVWRSQLFFISGLLPKDCMCTQSVMSFDMEEQSWNVSWPPIQTPRCSHLAVVVDDNIFVFGNVRQRPIPRNKWGELFEITTNQWSYLPSPPYPLYDLQNPRAYSVYYKCKEFKYKTKKDDLFLVPQNQDLILFPLPGSGSPISVFNCTDRTWLPDLYPELPNRATIFPFDILNSRDRLAVIDGVLLWHLDEAIHGYDFIKREFLSYLFEIPPSRHHDSDHYGFPHQPPMFLLPVDEDHKLFYIFQYSCDPHNVHCYEFLVRLDPRLSLERLSYSRLSTASMGHTSLQDVILLGGPR